MTTRDGSRTTRDKLLDASMELFAERGFKATTTKDIAAKVGIKDASIYNHFGSKQEIFDAIIERALSRLQETLHGSDALFETSDNPRAYLTRDADDLSRVVLDSYRPFFADAELVCLRKMLVVNQFESERAGQLFQRIFIDQPLDLQTALFDRLVADGLFERCNTRLAAYEFHGPVFLLLMQNASWTEAKSRIQAHLRAFERAHRAAR